MKALCALALVLAVPAAARAQDEPPSISIRPFVLGTAQAFKAMNTFEAVFGQRVQPFFGGGVQAVFDGRYFVEAGASRFRKTGQRAFRSNGQNFGLGIPLTTEIVPFEVTGGYRFHLARAPRAIPYGAAGFGTYRYKETSPSSDPAENVSVRHAGFVVNGGVEVRLHRWVGVSADAQYTHIPGILGSGGLSKDAGESDLGGIAARVKVVVGR